MLRRAVTPQRLLLAHLFPVLLLSACKGDDPQVPTALASSNGAVLTAPVATAVPTPPTVILKDQRGNGIANAWVHWTVASGSGHVANDSSRTDAAGLALSGGWTLGTTVGNQALTARANGLPPVTFTAQAIPGAPRSLNILSINPQPGVVNTDVQNPPSVRAVDQYGNAVAGVAIAFTVSSGGGSIAGAQQTTNADGIATATSWKLGTIAGSQLARADAAQAGVTATFSANVQGGPPVTLVAVDGDGQQGSAGRPVCVRPMVRLEDLYGNPVGLSPITFTPGIGSGSATGSTVVTDVTTGIATVGGWTLGSGTTQTLVATSFLVPGKQVTFTATARPAPGYAICARFIGDGGTPRQREAVAKAVARWQSVIVGHVQTSRLRVPANDCLSQVPAIDEDVEDLLLYVQLTAIDGPNNVIGQARPCYVHLPSALTLMGFLQLDLADLDLMSANGTIDNVVLHEIGHIIGIGTLWDFQRNLLNGRGSFDPFFLGAAARDQFALTGSNYPGNPVPIENTGGVGTRDSHWRKSVFGNELMQGIVAQTMPMSRVTIGSLADLGYIVNLNAADPFSLLPSLRLGAPPVGIEMVNDVVEGTIWGIEKNGTKRLLRSAALPIRR